jgi:pimeloyl-ACP methyl ester carboxylesterase
MSTDQLQNVELPHGVRARYINNHNGLMVHVLEAGFETPNRPAVLLLHGFPELAYSWRKIMLPLAAAGYHVIAPDQRGYGWTTGWDGSYDGELAPFRTHNMARDALGLAMAMGHRQVAAVVGHDFGSIVASYCALVRPDFFKTVALLSIPFPGVPDIPFNVPHAPLDAASPASMFDAQLASLPQPRKDNMVYFASREANEDMMACPQGVHDFLRAYFHMKSGDWEGNAPYVLPEATPEEFAKIPRYYIMDRDATMPETVRPEMPTEEEIEHCLWLTDDELRVYSDAFSRTGFSGAVQWYRCHTGTIGKAELELYSGVTIDVPSCFIAGRKDWGVFRKPGNVERMRESACTKMDDFHLIEGAGHWIQQEAPDQVSKILIDFLSRTSGVQS